MDKREFELKWSWLHYLSAVDIGALFKDVDSVIENEIHKRMPTKVEREQKMAEYAKRARFIHWRVAFVLGCYFVRNRMLGK